MKQNRLGCGYLDLQETFLCYLEHDLEEDFHLELLDMRK